MQIQGRWTNLKVAEDTGDLLQEAEGEFEEAGEEDEGMEDHWKEKETVKKNHETWKLQKSQKINLTSYICRTQTNHLLFFVYSSKESVSISRIWNKSEHFFE